jgi:hypothetical protein
MAYTTAFAGTSSNVARYDRDKWTSSVATSVPQLNTTQYWIAQAKQATQRVWVANTTEPTNV